MEQVVLKGNKYGINVILHPDCEFEELRRSVQNKFKAAADFFGKANVALSFDGRDLSEEEESILLQDIDQTDTVTVICVVDNSEILEEVYKGKTALLAREVQYPRVEHLTEVPKDATIECMHEVLVLGDIGQGGKLIAESHVMVLGTICGEVVLKEDSVLLAANPLKGTIWFGEVCYKPETSVRKGGLFLSLIHI